MKTVIVTGAAGFLGSHICEHYLKQGYNVLGVDNFSTGSKTNITYLQSLYHAFKFLEFDVCHDWISLDVLSDKKDIKYVFHFASPASPPLYQKLALETLWVNTLGLNNALLFADKHKARLIFASTSEVYGDPAISPQHENYWGNVNSFGERSCYDEAKRFGEALIFSHNKKHNTQHGLVRIFNTYGPRMNPHDGRVVINFILQAHQAQNLTIYGDGKQTRSFCFVSDLIRGIDLYAKSDITFPINLGNSHEFTMLDLANIVLKITGSSSLFSFLPLPSDDPKRRQPDLTNAEKHLGYNPEISLEHGVAMMYEWLKTQM